jgi:hypothetical protein
VCVGHIQPKESLGAIPLQRYERVTIAMPNTSEAVNEPWQRLSAHVLPGASGPWQRAAPVLALIVAATAIIAFAALPIPGSAHADTRPTARLPATGPARVLMERADLHVDDLPSDAELEVDLSISQSQGDCQMALHGQLCLRYTILLGDRPVQAGYGLIPVANVTMSPPTITLRTDTRHESQFVRTAGPGGVISLTWFSAAGWSHASARGTSFADAVVRGTLAGYAIPATHVTAGVLLYGEP